MGKFYDLWIASHVRVIAGPFAGREGQVRGAAEPWVEVSFPESVLQRDWILFDASQLERVYHKDACGGPVQLLDEPDEPVGWWGPWVFVLVLLAGSIVLWHLLGAPVWEGGF